LSALSNVGKALIRSVRDMIEHDLVVRAPRPRIKPKIARDNPGGDWLVHQERRAAQSTHPVSGAITAYTRRPIEMDPRKIRHLPGAMGERRVKGDEQYDRLHEAVKRSGGLHEDAPIVIGVNHIGKPYIIEGNTRTAVADDLGIRAVPAEVRYFAGGERYAGIHDWDLKQLEKYMAPSELVSSPRFRRWFDGSAMADEYGEPLSFYHGTNKNFSAFRRSDNGDVGIHMGTPDQANDRIDALSKRWLETGENTPHVLPVYANFKNPYRIRDIGNFDTENMDYQIHDSFNRHFYEPGDVHDYLADNGYDGLVYKNTGETAGASAYRDAADDALSRWQELYAKYAPGYKRSHHFSVSPSFRKMHPDFDDAYTDYERKAAEYKAFRDANAEDSFAAFYPTQIKSRFNRGTFDPYDPDISKAEGGLIR